MRIDQLNGELGRGDALHFVSGHGNLPKAILRHPSGASCDIYLYGAHVSSWKDAGENELLFMSPKADFAEGKPIRGGIPLVFPQFGGGALPSHGFARISNWSVIDTVASANEVGIRLVLEASTELRKMWDHDFRCEFSVSLLPELRTSFSCSNIGSSSFSVQQAFHTYFAVKDIGHVEVRDLEGLELLDSLKNREKSVESRKVIGVAEEIDRIYLNAPDTIHLADLAAGRTFTIKKTNMPDAVVWNPWIRRCKEIADLGDEDYKRFICVESGTLGTPASVPHDRTWTCSQTVAVSS